VQATVDEQPAWWIACFFVAPSHRGRGLTRLLLEAACAWAAAHGARRLEGCPVEPAEGVRFPAAFAWHGLASAYRAAGFREVARRAATRPLMRRELGRARAGRSGGARG